MNIPPDLKDRVASLEKRFPNVPPAVQHLFALLPVPGERFTAEQRVNFLQAATCIFAMVYGFEEPLSIKISPAPAVTNGDSNNQ